MGKYKFNPLIGDDFDIVGADLSGLSGIGFIVQTGPGTYALRTLTAGAGISITDGNGGSGNPVISATGGGSSSWLRTFLMMGA